MNSLDRINLELLRTFVIAATSPTFAEASRRRGVTVSAISQQMKTLETQLGLPLFERVGRRVRLTGNGRSLSETVHRHLEALATAFDEATGADVSLAGTVVIGGPRPFGRHFVGPRLIALRKQHPRLRVDQRFDVPSVLERQLVDGALDFAILGRPVETAGLASTPIATEIFVCVASRTFLSRKPPGRDRKALEAWPWLVFDADLPMHGPWWKVRFGRLATLPNEVTASIASLEQLEDYAVAGLGAVVLPDYLVAGSLAQKRLVEVVVDEPGRTLRPARNTLFLAWRRRVPMTARRLAVKRALTGSNG